MIVPPSKVAREAAFFFVWRYSGRWPPRREPRMSKGHMEGGSLDLRSLVGGVSVTDLGLNDFRMDLVAMLGLSQVGFSIPSTSYD